MLHEEVLATLGGTDAVSKKQVPTLHFRKLQSKFTHQPSSQNMECQHVKDVMFPWDKNWIDKAAMKQVIADSHFTPQDKKLLVHLKKELESNRHPHPSSIAQTIYGNDPNVNQPQFEKLTNRYGPGSFVLLFETIHDFQINKRCFIPKIMGQIPTDCVLSKSKKIIFAPNHILDIMGLLGHSKRTWGRLMSIQIGIYYDYNQSSVMRSYDALGFWPNHLDELLLGHRINISLIRRQYRDFMPIFREDQKCHFINYFGDPQLKQLPELATPRLMPDFIEDINESQREQLRKVIEAAHRERTVIARQKALLQVLKTVGDFKRFEIFRNRAIKAQFERMMKWITAINMKFAKRVCAHCKMQEIHHQSPDEFIQYKLCSKCKNVFYCSRHCQKKDWRQIHRLKCI